MKIRQVLEGLLSGEDFSDHNFASAGETPRLMHDNCAFCDTWRAALALVNGHAPIAVEFFEAGDKVFLPGRIPGRVMGTSITVQVEVQRGEHGPWAVGSFSPLALIAQDDAPQFTYWSNKADDIWEREEATQRIRLIRYDGQTMPVKPWAIINRAFDDLLDVHGALIQVDKP